jgi:hypothetical protein
VESLDGAILRCYGLKPSDSAPLSLPIKLPRRLLAWQSVAHDPRRGNA